MCIILCSDRCFEIDALLRPGNDINIKKFKYNLKKWMNIS